MPPSVHVGTILMKESPEMTQLLGLKSEPCSGSWSVVKALDGLGLDRKIHAAGWNFFYMAAEVQVTFFGSVGATKMQNAVKRLLEKVKQDNFNGLEVTGIAAKHFLGVPYVTVSAHSRHVQQSCYLDGAALRQSPLHDTEQAKG